MTDLDTQGKRNPAEAHWDREMLCSMQGDRLRPCQMLLQQQNGQPTHGCLSNRPIPTFMGVAANGTPPIAPIKVFIQ
ncbi:hypothetical protein AMECASPLE_023935 [Ameca splendens]|uniref:Uncharacterized protein n=1 Tax=Ameca splendens TaxID=208324 RepID=A0ABV0Y4V2_9TELE